MSEPSTVPGSRRFAPGSGRFAPAGGWLALVLVVVLCVTLAWSLDDARLVIGSDALTDFLLYAAIGGAVAGFIGPLAGWGRWRTFLLGAILAGLLVPLFVGGAMAVHANLPEADVTLAKRFELAADAAAVAVKDLIVDRRATTSQYGHHLLVLGLWVWASALFASFAVFGHRRPLSAIALVGLLLLANMTLTVNDQLPMLVVFSLASLFLLILMHAFEEQSEWLRRRIGDPSTISGLYARGGTLFIGVAVIGSLLLTQVAASAPLAGAWSDVGSAAIDWTRQFSGLLPQSGTGVTVGPAFGTRSTITGAWFTNDQVAMTIEVPAADRDVRPYWRAVTFDLLQLDGYERSRDTVAAERAAGTSLLAETAEDVVPEGRTAHTFRITPVRGATIFAPQTPVEVSVPTTLTLVGEGGYLTAIDRADRGGPYTVTSLIPMTGDEEDRALTKNKLRVAGDDYPTEIVERYAARPDPGIIGPAARAVMTDILQSRPTNAYDLAEAIVSYLQNGNNFQYDTDIHDNGVDCAGRSAVECFAVIRRGYCQYYASMMTAFLRENRIPARVAEGFLPGDRAGGGVETIRNNGAHAWVEVYFPGYGWVDFDPTGGGRAALPALPAGAVQSAPPTLPSARPSPLGPLETDLIGEARSPLPNAGQERQGGPASLGPLIAVTILLALVVGSLAVVTWSRGPRGPVTADGAWTTVSRMAARFGFGPRPEQTVYEYAGALGDVLPESRPELETVARAKVEVAYGARQLGSERLGDLRDAQRRLRVSLLRLALIRGRRTRRR